MQLILLSVFDSAAGAYNRPFTAPSVGLAVRTFKDECNRIPQTAEGNPMYAHPTDFTLHQIGVFDDADGSITPCKPLLVSRAIDLKE